MSELTAVERIARYGVCLRCRKPRDVRMRQLGDGGTELELVCSCPDGEVQA